MDKFNIWMSEVFAPKMNKLTNNPWISAIQESILTVMPAILIGSFTTLVGSLSNFFPDFPNLSQISNFSFGLFSLFLAYLIPNTVMERKKQKDRAKIAGCAGISLFLLVVYPGFDDAGNINIIFSTLGAGGMIASLVSGLFVAVVFNLAAKFSFFSEESNLPDFIVSWFDNLIPWIVVIVAGWVCTFLLHVNLFDIIRSIFQPLQNFGQSYWGFMLLYFFGVVGLYSFGISSWVVYPILLVIWNTGIAGNIDAVAQGLAPTNIHVQQIFTLMAIGGNGTTLSLAFMLSFAAKSKQLKTTGKATLIPSIFNINEPLMYGAPVCFNPILMIPLWINAIIIPTILWFTFSLGLIAIPGELLALTSRIPTFISAFIKFGFGGVLLTIVLFIISGLIYYPFFKVYDKQVCDKEKAENV